MEKLRSASVPHIRFDLPRKPFPHFTIHTRILQCGWKHSGKFALLFSFLVILSVLAPYTMSLAKGKVRYLIPLISQESMQQPESGLFSLLLYITATIGAIMVSVRYVHVCSQNEERNWRLNVLNKISLTSGIASFGGLIVIASFRVSLPDDQQKPLDSTLFLPHIMGAFFAFFFGALYLLFQTCLSLFFYEGNGRLVLLRFALFLACSVCFVTSTLTAIAHGKVWDITDIYLQSDIIVKPLKEPHLAGTVCEWLMVFFFALYFLTFVKESQRISVVITFRHLLTRRRISLATLTNMSKI